MKKKVHLEFNTGAPGLPEEYQGEAILFDANNDGVGSFYIPAGKITCAQIIELAKAEVPKGFILDEANANIVIKEWLKQ